MLWTLAVAIPAFVIWSRMLRGMHHRPMSPPAS